MKARTVFYGASITNRMQAQVEGSVRRATYVSTFLAKHGYQCCADVVLDAGLFSSNTIEENNIPDKYLELCSPKMLNEFTIIRMAGKDVLRNDLACHYWGLEVMRESCCCVWDLTLPSIGAGFEIATALAMNKKCFCFSENTTISSTISGCPSPLLRVAPFDDKIGQLLLSFFSE